MPEVATDAGLIVPSADDLGQEFDWLDIVESKEARFLQPIVDRAQAEVQHFQPLTVAERLEAFEDFGYRPLGLYLPEDKGLLALYRAKQAEIGAVEDVSERLLRYFALQDETAWLEKDGIPGRWRGQAAIARSAARYRIVVIGRRGGKALALDTPLPTPTGWTTMGDVEVGDELLDEQGRPCRVTYKTETMVDHECFDVEFSDGQHITADAEHLWWAESKAQRRTDMPPSSRNMKRDRTKPVVLTTKQLLELEQAHKTAAWAVPCAKPLELPEDEFLPIDPYVLGAWLGDGTSSTAGFTSADPEIVEELRRRGYTVTEAKGSDDRCSSYVIRTTRALLRGLGVRNNKHIPQRYLRASYQQRLDLLQGLMDTDGGADTRGKCEFTSTRQCLAEGVVELLGTLGQKAQVTVGRAMLKGRYIGPKYRVIFTPTSPVFKLERKLQRQKLGPGWFRTRRYIVSITPVDSVPVACITVDSPNHLYLCGNFIPTHNTFHSAREAVAVLKKKPRSVVWVVARTMESVARCFDEIARFLTDLGEKPKARSWRDSEQEKHIVLENGSICEGKSLEGEVAGLAVDLVIVEEAKTILKEQWIKDIRPTLTDKMGRALIISSLEGTDSFFYQQYVEAKRQREKDLAAGVDQSEIEWDYFRDPSWEVNFAAFPQGRQSAAIKSEERGMPARDFLEQFGAVPMPSDLLVYPEFRPRVHVGHYAWNPELGVFVTIDPSGGGNPYAAAILQDYGDRLVQIDEVYETGSTGNAEAVNEIMRSREWCEADLSNITGVLCDSAASDDIRRLSNMGWPIEAVYDKPEVWQRLPVLRNMLRQPSHFYQVRRQYMVSFLVDMGYPADVDPDSIDPDDEAKMLLQLEEALADENLTAEDVENLQACARYMVDECCFNTIFEFQNYSYNKTRNMRNIREKPLEKHDHVMDCLGYYVWQNKRFDDATRRPQALNVRGAIIHLNVQPTVIGSDQITVAPLQPPDTDFRGRMRGYLESVRNHYDGQVTPDYSLLERV